MEASLVESLLKSGGPWAAALVIVCIYFVREMTKKDKALLDAETRRTKELEDLETKNRAELDAKVKAAVEFSTQKQISDLQVAHHARVQELNTSMITMQAEHNQQRLRDHEEFRKALLTREQEVINALNASSVASEEQSKTMEQLREALMNGPQPAITKRTTR